MSAKRIPAGTPKSLEIIMLFEAFFSSAYSANNGSSFTIYYYLRNAQGDIVKLIDGSGSTVVKYVYDSWGKVLSIAGTYSGTVRANQPFRYRGYVYDEETQWYYLQSRYYDPAVRRFISADVYLSTGQGVLGHNAFAYCNNNPVVRIDSNGAIWYEVLFSFFNAKVQLMQSSCPNAYDLLDYEHLT